MNIFFAKTVCQRLLILAVICISLLPALSYAQAVPATADANVAKAAPAENDTNTDMIPTKSLLSIIKDGGYLMIPLLICSFTLLVFTFERAISMRVGRVMPRPFVKRFLHQLEERQLDKEQALLVCEENGSPISLVFAAACRKWGKSSVEIEQAILDAGERAANDLRRFIRIFNGLATVSPLLGLLGTVFGIIRAFNDIATSDAMGRMELLSTGISEALLTTAMGLSVAIPSICLYIYFSGCLDRLVIRIDALGQQVV
ncbi:MAG: MotA/TolQ/ExbB proton channel family protein, partial [Planctomycetota bacterium]|nr:MotA/TolQ/ExbB proton channel family protein [Planctomycetota bacterium]